MLRAGKCPCHHRRYFAQAREPDAGAAHQPRLSPMRLRLHLSFSAADAYRPRCYFLCVSDDVTPPRPLAACFSRRAETTIYATRRYDDALSLKEAWAQWRFEAGFTPRARFAAAGAGKHY